MELREAGNTREFLETVLPWSAGFYFGLHWVTTKVGRDGRPIWWSRAFETLDAFMKGLAYVARHPTTKDIYFCTSSQNVYIDKIVNGKSFWVAVRGQNTAAMMQSIFVDVDVKEGKYETTDDAKAAMLAFIEVTGLPPPSAVVASGTGGIHVYWSFEEPVTPVVWQPLANALASALTTHGVHCDTACTIDSARVLRVPGTLNFKPEKTGGNPLEVDVIGLGDLVPFEALTDALSEFMGPSTVKGTSQGMALVPTGKMVDNSDLTANVPSIKFPLAEVAKVCPFVNLAVMEGGASYDNPLWHRTTFLASFTTEGREAAHIMASGHAGYTRESTDDQYDRVEKSRTEKDLGYPKCAQLLLSGSKPCATCPHVGSGKSPFNFVAPEVTAVATAAVTGVSPADALPLGYFRNPEGQICKSVMRPDGGQEAFVIIRWPLTDVWVLKDPWRLLFTVKLGKFKPEVVELPTTDISTKDALAKALAANGMMLNEHEIKHAKELFMSWITQLQHSKANETSGASYGWIFKHGRLAGFAYNGIVWKDGGGEETATPAPHGTKKTFEPTGTIDPWRAAAQAVIDRKRPEWAILLATAFAGPLMKFAAESGALLHAYSINSGIGKSSAMKTAQAVWGKPKGAMFVAESTVNSVLGQLGTTRNLTAYWDEISGGENMKKVSQLIFSLTLGIEKSRMRQDTSQRERGEWHTLLCTAANVSIMDTLGRTNKSGSNADVYRVFEYNLEQDKGNLALNSDISRLIDTLLENYGQAGLIYAKFLGANANAIYDEFSKFHNELNKEVGASTAERFWVSIMSTLLAGAKFAKDCGLVDFDIEAMKVFLFDALTGMRNQIDQGQEYDLTNPDSVSTVLSQFFNEMNARHTIVTNRINVGRGKPPKGIYKILNDCSRLEAIYVQKGMDDRLTRVSSVYFSRWCEENGYSRVTLLKTLRDQYGLKQMPGGVLGSGTERSTGVAEYLLEFDLNHPSFKTMFE